MNSWVQETNKLSNLVVTSKWKRNVSVSHIFTKWKWNPKCRTNARGFNETAMSLKFDPCRPIPVWVIPSNCHRYGANYYPRNPITIYLLPASQYKSIITSSFPFYFTLSLPYSNCSSILICLDKGYYDRFDLSLIWF